MEDLRSFGAGALAGLASAAIVHPVDTLRTVIMTADSQLSIVQAFKQVTTTSYSPLYRGLGIVLATNTLGNAVFLGGYDACQRRFSQHMHPVLSQAVSGFVGNLGATLVFCPVEVVKQRQQALGGTAQYASLSSSIRSIYRLHGLRGFLRGMSSSVATWGPAASLYFMSYEYLQRRTASLQSTATSTAIWYVDPRLL